MPIQVRPSGPIPAEVMVVGEAPGAEEERMGEPFVGASGMELTRMLHDAGINRSQCFITNVARERPYGNDIEEFIAKAKKDITPEHKKLRDKWVKRPITEGFELLKKEIEFVKPKMIIAVGNTALWALTGKWGITKWRGSMIHVDFAPHIKLIPTYHPAMILRMWHHRAAAVQDLRRANQYTRQAYPDPGWRFTVRPDYAKVIQILDMLQSMADAIENLELSFDLETRDGHIACAGISWTLQDALCIPFMCVERKEGYWSEQEEAEIVWRLYKLLRHPNVVTVGQNYLYDSQYTHRHWCFVSRRVSDTMISQHVAYAGLRKSLAFQASMYCDQYVYWKDDGKVWDKKMGEDSLWLYNCEDVVRTQECRNEENKILARMGLTQIDAAQQEMFWPVLRAMNLGVRIRKEVRAEMGMQLLDEMEARQSWFETVLGHKLNPRSPKQMQALFYDDLKLPIQRNGPSVTCDGDALDRLAIREPLIKPLINRISEYRTLGIYMSNFIEAPLDVDGRMRCSYNVCGAETYRLSSSTNAFDSGTNLQVIPGEKEAKEDGLKLPNIKTMFGPDPGYEFFDLDLDRADLQVVVWEADDKELKQALRLGLDMHCFNAVSIYKIKGIPPEELVESHPNYKERRAQIGYKNRQNCKVAVHAVDYGCKARTLAISLGCTVKEADDFIAGWFARHPGIRNWHERTEIALRTKRMVKNAYGYQRFYFDRIDGMLPEALAWIPQSTVAVTINKIWRNVFHSLPSVQVLLQVHDSLAGQYPIGFDTGAIRENSRVVVPYPDPLIIPVGIKTSRISWGDCA